MRRPIQYIIAAIFLLALLFAAVSCSRKELTRWEDEQMVAYIPIITDWSQSLIDTEEMTNISIHIFEEGCDEPMVIVSDNHTFNLVKLPIGRYSLLIFNEMVSDLDELDFHDEDNFEQIGARIIRNTDSSPSLYDVSENEHYTLHHPRLAAWHLSSLVVDQELIDETTTNEFLNYISMARSRSLTKSTKNATRATPLAPLSTRSLDLLSATTPTPITTNVTVNVRIENLNSATKIEGILSGTASGMTLTSRISERAEEETNIYDLPFTERTYDNTSDKKNGEVSYSFNTFGQTFESGDRYTLLINILLYDGTMQSVTRDVTADFQQDTDFQIVIDLTTGDNIIKLPASAENGFEVNGWGDATQVTL